MLTEHLSDGIPREITVQDGARDVIGLNRIDLKAVNPVLIHPMSARPAGEVQLGQLGIEQV